jgi:pimeloyl-ACP methyl ester carboxylesterase
MKPTELDLNAIQGRVDAASSGPWEATAQGGIEQRNYSGPGEVFDSIASVREHGDWMFIAHAREDVAALLAEIAELNASRDLAFKIRDNAIDQANREKQRGDLYGATLIAIYGKDWPIEHADFIAETLAARDAENKAVGWDEGHSHCFHVENPNNPVKGNPYRTQKEA